MSFDKFRLGGNSIIVVYQCSVFFKHEPPFKLNCKYTLMFDILIKVIDDIVVSAKLFIEIAVGQRVHQRVILLKK